MPIGPQLPPHLMRDNAVEAEKEEESDDDFGPALPPHLAAARKAAPKTRDIGPQRPDGLSVGPSAGPSVGPSVGPSLPESDSDDDVIGPLPSSTPVPEKSAADAFREREARMAAERQAGKSESSKPQRAEWMLVPPSAGVLGGLDPTKRPTSFNKTSRANVTAEEQRVWTETPAERAQRAAEEISGVKRRHEGDEELERRRKRERDEEIRKNVEAHNKASRGGSLLSQHQKRKADAEEEDEPAYWDHSKHMGVTGRLLSNEERAEKIKAAKNLNDRFGHGKRGAYE